MKILFYSKSIDIGISKACCALCLVMKQKNILHRCHGVAFRNWTIPEELNFEEFAGTLPLDIGVDENVVKLIISNIGILDDDFLKETLKCQLILPRKIEN